MRISIQIMFSVLTQVDLKCNFWLGIFQVMETKNMLYLVSEYAPNGEIFGEWSLHCIRSGHESEDIFMWPRPSWHSRSFLDVTSGYSLNRLPMTTNFVLIIGDSLIWAVPKLCPKLFLPQQGPCPKGHPIVHSIVHPGWATSWEIKQSGIYPYKNLCKKSLPLRWC